MSNFNQVNRRSFLKASSIGTAVAVADITLPFNVMAADVWGSDNICIERNKKIWCEKNAVKPLFMGLCCF